MKNAAMSHRFSGMAILASAVGLVSACVSPRTHVLETPRSVAHDRVVRIARGTSTVQVDAKLQEAFEERLTERLQSRAMLTTEDKSGATFTIEYRFVLQDNGSSGVRLGAGIASLVGSPFYGLGDGAVGVEVVYRDQGGASIGHTVTDAPISGVFASVESGVKDAAATIADYTRDHYAEMAKPVLAAK